MKTIIFTILLAFAWHHFYYVSSAPDLGNGIQVHTDPFQENISSRSFKLHGFDITPRANFFITARVLSAEKYYFDTESNLSPIDFALGWREMSDSAFLDKLDIDQGGRWYSWTTNDSTIDRKLIEHQSGNMHMVPATEEVAEILNAVRIGDVVEIDGQLIDVKNSSSWKWKTSLSRTDVGDGACEIVYVKSIRIRNGY